MVVAMRTARGGKLLLGATKVLAWAVESALVVDDEGWRMEARKMSDGCGMEFSVSAARIAVVVLAGIAVMTLILSIWRH